VNVQKEQLWNISNSADSMPPSQATQLRKIKIAVFGIYEDGKSLLAFWRTLCLHLLH
jgi:hypothetical protein